MKRVALILLIALGSSLSALAQTSKAKRPALPSDIKRAAGQDSDSLLKNPIIKARMRKLLGKRYASFMESFETLTPVTKEGNFLFSTGCLIHACTHLESAIAIDLNRRTIHLAIFRQDERTRYFNEGRRPTPKVISDWANHLREINIPSNSSHSKRFVAPADVAGRGVEISSPRRLSGPASVRRGFIGGESHDGYVVRARKGQVMTVRLSWQPEGDTHASLAVSESPDFYSGKQVKFGTEDNDGQRWTGRVPKTGDYYLNVVAHPSAHYTLKVNLR